MSKINNVGTNAITTLITLTKTALNEKVNKVEGKVLSTHDYTTEEKTKLANIAEGATNVSKVSQLTNDSGFQTAADVDAKVSSAVSSVYKAGGTVFGLADLPPADEAHLGMVYNVSDAFTTNANFLDSTGKSFPAGTNVVVVADGAGFKYDVLAGFVDLSGYVASSDLQELTTEEVTAIWNNVTV